MLWGATEGIREGQWPEQSCAFRGCLGVAVSGGGQKESCTLARVIWGLPPPTALFLKQVLILLLPLTTSHFT